MGSKSIIWHLFGSAESPGYSPQDVQGCSMLTLQGLCWKPQQPCTSLCLCLTQMCFVWKWGQMAWIHLFLLHKHKTKTKTGGARRGCTLLPDPNILTNTAQTCYQMETMVILKEKKIQIPFCKVGAVHLSLHLAEQQTLSIWNTPLGVALHKNKPLLLPPPLPTLSLELRACLGFGMLEPAPSCSIQKRRAIFLPERGNSRRLTGTQVQKWAPIILCKISKISQSLVGGATLLSHILNKCLTSPCPCAGLTAVSHSLTQLTHYFSWLSHPNADQTWSYSTTHKIFIHPK